MSDLPSTADLSRGGADLSGRDLGDYHILHRLGRGGMADVYLAEQHSLGRRVALKVLQARLAGDTVYIQRFQNEARAAAALVHANIVQIYEVGCRDGVHFIAQEYVDGPNLRQLLARRGTLDVGPTVQILRQVAAALHKAAQVGIVHRDIKPENIMLTAGGEVKVADFGLARATNRPADLNLTQEGMTLGTPLYMSPEQVEGRPVDPRSDLYSLGATAYHVLAGRPPFEGDSSLAIAIQHLRNEPVPLAQYRPDLPPELCEIVHKLLAKAPVERFQQPQELFRSLRQLALQRGEAQEDELALEWSDADLLALSGIGLALTRKLDTLMKTQVVTRSRRRWWLGSTAAAFVAGALGLILAAMTRPASQLAATTAAAPEIEHKETVKDQFFLAMQLGTPAAYRSVARYFPASDSPVNAYYVHRAGQQLGELYFGQDDWARAFEVYGQLAALDDDEETEFKASGLIGQANVHAVRGETAQATSKLAQVVPLLAKLKPNIRAQITQQLVPRLRPTYQQLLRDTQATNSTESRSTEPSTGRTQFGAGGD